MRYLKTNTATRVTVGPFLDVTDAKTPEVALTATNEHLTLVVDDGGVPTLVLDANATASGGNNDMVHITNDDAGYYDLELTAAQTNYLGRAVLSINYVTDHLPVFHEFMILSAQAYDSLFGTGNLSADVKAINAVSTSSVTTVSAYQGTTAANTAQTGDNYARLGAPAGASVSADIATIDGIVDTIVARIIGTLAAGTHNAQSGDAYARLGAPSGASVSADILTLLNRIVGTLAAGTHNPQSGDAYARLGAPVAASISADIAVMDAIIDTLLTRIVGTLAAGTHNPQSGDSYARIGANGSSLTSLATAALQSTIAGYLDTEVAAILAAVDTEVAAIKTVTDQMVFTTPNKIDATATVALAPEDITDIADAVVAGLGEVTDPLLNTVPGAYAAGSAGYALGAIKAKTDTLGGAGSVSWVYTLTEDGTGNPIPEAFVRITSDEAGEVVIATGITNEDGQIQFYLNPGTVYVWVQKIGWSFTNPSSKVVS